MLGTRYIVTWCTAERNQRKGHVLYIADGVVGAINQRRQGDGAIVWRGFEVEDVLLEHWSPS